MSTGGLVREPAYATALRQALGQRDATRPGRPATAPEPTSPGDTQHPTHRIVTGLVDLIAALHQQPGRIDGAAQQQVARALDAGRPSWAAAARAVWALRLWQLQDENAAMSQLVLAELDLEDEAAGGIRDADPDGGPTGPAAAANNLGNAYTVMRLFELAEPHLRRAFELSSTTYGPHLAVQVCIDQLNIAESQLRWAFHCESVGRPDEARLRASIAAHAAADAAQRCERADWPAQVRFARGLEAGARAVTEPGAISADDLAVVEEALERGVDGGTLVVVVLTAVKARLLRLLRRPDEAFDAALLLQRLGTAGDPTMAIAAWREASIAQGGAGGASERYARALADELEAGRNRAAGAFRSRLTMAGLERRHAEVTASHGRLQQALDAAAAEEAALLHAATHDPLTDLPNRALLTERLNAALGHAVEDGRILSVAFVDLDGFKEVNDGLGHAAGDDVLRRTADQLRAAVQPHDTVARIGGDEFVVVLLSEPTADGAERWARLLAGSLAGDGSAASLLPRSSASVGVCTLLAPSGWTAEDALAAADRAMYAAKQRGGARAVVVTRAEPYAPPT